MLSYHVTRPKPLGTPSELALNRPSGFACRDLLGFCVAIHQADSAILLRPRLVITSPPQCRNINRLSISYAFRPRLRDRLTLSGLTFLRKP